jgi:hypothetical protein
MSDILCEIFEVPRDIAEALINNYDTAEAAAEAILADPTLKSRTNPLIAALLESAGDAFGDDGNLGDDAFGNDDAFGADEEDHGNDGDETFGDDEPEVKRRRVEADFCSPTGPRGASPLISVASLNPTLEQRRAVKSVSAGTVDPLAKSAVAGLESESETDWGKTEWGKRFDLQEMKWNHRLRLTHFWEGVA